MPIPNTGPSLLFLVFLDLLSPVGRTCGLLEPSLRDARREAADELAIEVKRLWAVLAVVMDPREIRAWGAGFRAGSNAAKRAMIGGVLAEAQALAAELACLFREQTGNSLQVTVARAWAIVPE